METFLIVSEDGKDAYKVGQGGQARHDQAAHHQNTTGLSTTRFISFLSCYITFLPTLLEFLSLWLNLSRWLPLFLDQGGRTRLCTGTTGNHNRCSLLSGSCWNQNPPHIPQTWRDAWACWLPNPHTPPTRLENLRMLGLQEPFYHNFNGWAHTLNMLICPSGAPEMPSCVEQIIVEKSGSF